MSAIQTMERTWEFWSSGLKGGPFEVWNDPAHYESAPHVVGHYDVGQVVRDYQRAWLGVAPNHATPIDLLDLLFYLDEFTDVLEREDVARRTAALGPIGITASCDEFEQNHPGYAQTCKDLQRWRKRLDEYLLFTASVPIEDEHDRRVTLWEVTAPLFVGWYGGETGVEIPLDPAAFPPGFDPMIRHPADLATPYMLANQFGIWVAWQDERKKRLVADLTDPFVPDGSDWWIALALGGALLGGAYLLRD